MINMISWLDSTANFMNICDVQESLWHAYSYVCSYYMCFGHGHSFGVQTWE